MSAKPAKPEKRKLAPRSGEITQQDAEELSAKFSSLAGQFMVLRDRMDDNKIKVVKFDGGNVVKRIIEDADLYLIDLEAAIRKAEVRYPGKAG